jgi:UDP-N-acetylmuramyl pentapeptide phosphotransferase/UDP-N-acetylglucosamine-1-phosphate transferase
MASMKRKMAKFPIGTIVQPDGYLTTRTSIAAMANAMNFTDAIDCLSLLLFFTALLASFGKPFFADGNNPQIANSGTCSANSSQMR